MVERSGSGRTIRIEIDPDEDFSDPPLTESLKRSVPWDPDRRKVARAGDAGF